MVLSMICAVGLLGIAIMIPVGTALYCDSEENAWKKVNSVDFPGFTADQF